MLYGKGNIRYLGLPGSKDGLPNIGDAAVTA